jgi:hypothetical protein
VRDWTLNDMQALAPAVASNTAFGTDHEPAIEEWNGTFKTYGDSPPCMPGDTIAFQGYTAPDNDAYGNGVEYAGNAVVKQVTLNLNFTGGEPVQYDVEFEGHLNFTTQGVSGSVILDLTNPNIPPIVNAGLQFSMNGSVWNPVPNVASCQLVFTNGVQEYVNSSTIVAVSSVNHLWKGRKAGNFDWALTIAQQDNIRTLFNKGDNVYFRPYVTATTYWDLKWGCIESFSGITVNRETGAIIQMSVNAKMKAQVAGVLGYVKKPDTTTFWPVPQS